MQPRRDIRRDDEAAGEQPQLAVYDSRRGTDRAMGILEGEPFLPGAHGRLSLQNDRAYVLASTGLMARLVGDLVKYCDWKRMLVCVSATCGRQRLPSLGSDALRPAYQSDKLHVYHAIASQLTEITTFFDSVRARSDWVFSPVDELPFPDAEDVAAKLEASGRIIFSSFWRDRVWLTFDCDDGNVVGVFPQDAGTDGFIAGLIEDGLAKVSGFLKDP